MKRTKRIVLAAALLMSLVLTACAKDTVRTVVTTEPDGEPLAQSVASAPPPKSEEAAPQEQLSAQIYLYGEQHAQEKIMEKEADLWYGHYHNEGLRHLFIESPYYTAEFLNQWMQSDSDEILDAVYEDWQGSAAYNPYIKAFYQRIKRECPETIFHGTDVGHQYATTGERFLKYLEENQLENTEQYKWAQENIEQGKYFYENSDDVYRENKMAENFSRAFDALNGESVMGIYGTAHIGIDAMDYTTRTVPSMANQLHTSYGDAIHTEDLSWIKDDIAPERMDTITVAGKQYQAAYFGKEDFAGSPNFQSRAFWRLENAYDDFKEKPKTGDVLPYNNYPMQIETGQVFLLEIVKADGSILKTYYRSDGNVWEGMLSTEEFTVE